MRNSRSWALSTVSAAALFSLFAAAPATAQTSAPGGDACSGPADQRDPNANCAPTDSSAGQATAQRETAATEGEGVIVVGSRIPRPNFDTVQPSTVLSSQAIEQRGFVNAADALNELPQFGIPGSSPVGAGPGRRLRQRPVVRRLPRPGQPAHAGPRQQPPLRQLELRQHIRPDGGGRAGRPRPDQYQAHRPHRDDRDRRRPDLRLPTPSPAPSTSCSRAITRASTSTRRTASAQRGDAHNYRFRALAGQNFLDGRANLTISAEYNQGRRASPIRTAAVTREQRCFYANCNPGSQFNQCLYPDGPASTRRLPAAYRSYSTSSA